MIMLTNPDIYPSEAIIADALKTSATAYLLFRKTITETPFNLNDDWRYYNEISDSAINFSHKELLLQAKPIGKLLPLTLEISNFNNQEDLENLLKIITLKIKLK